jgi:hypothetical protein
VYLTAGKLMEVFLNFYRPDVFSGCLHLLFKENTVPSDYPFYNFREEAVKQSLSKQKAFLNVLFSVVEFFQRYHHHPYNS